MANLTAFLSFGSFASHTWSEPRRGKIVFLAGARGFHSEPDKSARSDAADTPPRLFELCYVTGQSNAELDTLSAYNRQRHQC
jgi:hypothetical protein